MSNTSTTTTRRAQLTQLNDCFNYCLSAIAALNTDLKCAERRGDAASYDQILVVRSEILLVMRALLDASKSGAPINSGYFALSDFNYLIMGSEITAKMLKAIRISEHVAPSVVRLAL